MYRNASSRVRNQGLLLKPLPFAKKPIKSFARLRQRAYKGAGEQRESNIYDMTATTVAHNTALLSYSKPVSSL